MPIFRTQRPTKYDGTLAPGIKVVVIQHPPDRPSQIEVVLRAGIIKIDVIDADRANYSGDLIGPDRQHGAGRASETDPRQPQLGWFGLFVIHDPMPFGAEMLVTP